MTWGILDATLISSKVYMPADVPKSQINSSGLGYLDVSDRKNRKIEILMSMETSILYLVPCDLEK